VKAGDLVRWREQFDDGTPSLLGIIVEATKPGWMRVRWFNEDPSYTALIWNPFTEEPVKHLEVLSESW
tara:strand:+ start:1645 stop:1848 length:204 start_codon:yes stop_codon:yes gene_type:complete